MKYLAPVLFGLLLLPSLPTRAEDAKAITVADSVMEKMGGQKAWDETRHLVWNFFGRRQHAWDKWTGDIRIEGKNGKTGESYLILMNLHTQKGRAWKQGTEVEDDEVLGAMLHDGVSAWINDSYWLVMPYKLRDPGVHLRYFGELSTLDGHAADVLELTFDNVGRTPENRYLVYVGRDSGLVEQWDFFAKASDEEPSFQVPWQDWQPFGEILLSGHRGRNQLTDIAVFDELPRSVYESPEPTDLFPSTRED